jgi:enterobacterial common antigen flippase
MPPVADVGVFSIAIMLSEAVTVFAVSVNMALYPAVAASAESVAYSRRVAWRVMTLCTVLGAALVVVAAWAVPVLYGPAFTKATRLFAGLLAGVVCLAGEQVMASFFPASSRLRAAFVAMMLGAGMLVTLALVLVPSYGLPGLAWACSISQGATAGVLGVLFLSYGRPRSGSLNER